MSGLSALELAVIPAGAAIAGVALGIGGNAWLDSLRTRRQERRFRDAAIGELLTATTDVIFGVQAIRAAYQGRSGWRHYMRLAAIIFATCCSAFAAAGEISLDALLDWRQSGPAIDRLVAVDRDLDENQRTVALDIAGVLVPRTTRFFAAVAALTLGPDVKLANAVRDLTPAVTALLDVVAAKQRAYAQARGRAETALESFRAVADQRTR